MSFRELRNFTEIMRGLGYPRLISMENFRTPNFVLVSDILQWLVQRYDPNVDIPDSIATEHDRIIFLKSMAQLVYYKARIKLNIKKLYGADGYAVKELLKIATVLNQSTVVAASLKEMEDNETLQIKSSKFQDNVKSIRAIASELTDLGAKLYDLLEEELDLRKDRQMAISQPHNIDHIKEIIANKNSEGSEMITSLSDNIQSLRKDEESLKEKVKSKTADLVRSRKRLIRLQSFRPGFMDEFETKEKELQELYTQYVERYRNIEYLENELDKYRKAEADAMEENKRRLAILRKKMKEEELAIMRGDHHFGELEDDSDDSEEEDEEDDEEDEEDGDDSSEDPDLLMPQKYKNSRRPRAASGRRPSRGSIDKVEPKLANNQGAAASINVRQSHQLNANQLNSSRQVNPNGNRATAQKGMMYSDSDEDETDGEASDSDESMNASLSVRGRMGNNREMMDSGDSDEEVGADDYSVSEDDEF